MGSKGLPGKNLKSLGGKPLVAWTVQFAKMHGIDVIVSTESQEMIDVAQKEGARAPFLRKPELSADGTPSVDVVLDCLDFLELREGKTYEFVVMLEPTSPFRRSTLLQEAFALLIQGPAQAAVTVMRAGNAHPNFAMQPLDASFVGFSTPYGDDMSKRRQECGAIYYPEGCLYISTVSSLRERQTFYHEKTALIQVGQIESIDIDHASDLATCEMILTALKQDRNSVHTSFWKDFEWLLLDQ